MDKNLYPAATHGNAVQKWLRREYISGPVNYFDTKRLRFVFLKVSNKITMDNNIHSSKINTPHLATRYITKLLKQTAIQIGNGLKTEVEKVKLSMDALAYSLEDGFTGNTTINPSTRQLHNAKLSLIEVPMIYSKNNSL